MFVGPLGLSVGLVLAYFTITNVNSIARLCGINLFPTDSFGVEAIPTVTLPGDLILISGDPARAGDGELGEGER